VGTANKNSEFHQPMSAVRVLTDKKNKPEEGEQPMNVRYSTTAHFSPIGAEKRQFKYNTTGHQ